MDPSSGGVSPPPPPPHIVWRPSAASEIATFARPDQSASEANLVLAIRPGLIGTVGGDCGDGAGELVHTRIGRNLELRLADPALRWVNAAEPSPIVGSQAAAPIAIALASNGEDIVDSVTTDGRTLLADQDRGAVTRPRLGSLPDAEGFAAVYSRSRNTVFVVGGQVPGTARPSETIWFTRLGSHRWNRLPPSGYRPQNVLAAAYSFKTDKLYVLDELADGTARLVAIRVASLGVDWLGAWPRHVAWDRHALVVDGDGALLLASSNTMDRHHRLARIDDTLGPSERVTAVDCGHGALLVPPVVDADGLTLLTRKDVDGARRHRSRSFGFASTKSCADAHCGPPLGACGTLDLGPQL